MSQAIKQYSWSDLAKHASEDDCWVAIDGKVYDITKWLPQHPGGKEILVLSGGRDVTNLFESYHPMSDKPAQLLEKYQVGLVGSLEHPKYVVKSKFYSTLRERVRNHFLNTAQDPQSSVGVYTRLALVYLMMFVTHYFAYYVFSNFYINIIMAIVYGVAESLFSMHLMHDSSHFAITHSPTVWKWLGASFDFMIGGSFYAWIHQHTLGHHLYTNVRNADPDLGEGELDFRVVTPYQHREWYHKYQHIYAPILYGLYAFKTRVQDSESFIKRINGPIRVQQPTTFDTVAYVMGKVSTIFFRFILPLQFHSYSNVVIYFIVAELVFSWYLTINFQVSHVAEDLTFYGTPVKPNEPAQINEDWAISQVRTTQDYAHGSPAAAFFSGGLNHQVVHHLFPSIEQEFYPQLVPILKDVCKEFNITYHIRPTFTEAFMSHINYLYRMGNDPSYVKVDLNSKQKSK